MCTLIWDYFGGSLLPCSFISWQLHSIWLHKLIQQTPLCPTQPCSPSHQRFPHWSAYGTATTCTLHSISIPQLIKCLQPNALPYFWPAQKGSRTRYAQHLHWKDHREVASTKPRKQRQNRLIRSTAYERGAVSRQYLPMSQTHGLSNLHVYQSNPNAVSAFT
jgi:hypothetical protein